MLVALQMENTTPTMATGASNFEKLNPHLGSLADFHESIDVGPEKGINTIVDVVLNHAGYGAEETFKVWYGRRKKNTKATTN